MSETSFTIGLLLIMLLCFSLGYFAGFNNRKLLEKYKEDNPL